MDKKLEILKNQQDHHFSEMAKMLGVLSSPVRIKLIHFLAQGPLAVEVLAGKINQSVANTSMHLRKILSVGLVNVTTQSQSRIYSLHPATFEFWEACQNFIQKVDPDLFIDASKVYGDIDWKGSLISALEMVDSNEAILLDVRPDDEIKNSPDVKNIHHLSMENLLNDDLKLPKRKIILVFCRGRFCALSSHAVFNLRQKGFTAFRLNESWFSLDKMISQKGVEI